MPRVVSEPTENLALFRDACEWAERISLCLARADSGKGTSSVWSVLEPHLAKVQAAIVNLDGGSAEPELVRRLNSEGVLRVAPGAPAVMNANVYFFRRGPHARVLLGSSDFTGTGFERAISSTVYATGALDDEFFCGVRRLLERCAGLAHVPTLLHLEQYGRNWRRGESMLPGPPAEVATISVQEPLNIVTDPTDVAACVQLLAADCGITPRPTGPGATRDSALPQLIDDGSHWVLRLPGEDHGKHLEVSISKSAPDGRSDGAFAAGALSGTKYVVYRAVFRTRARVAEQLFWSTTRYRPLLLPTAGQEDPTRVAVVCQLGTVEVPAHVNGFAAELRRVREHGEDNELDEDTQPSEFLAEDSDAQIEAAWNILIGEGPLAKDTAVRLVARALREQGAVSYKRLDRGGQVYECIEAAIDAGIKDNWFDRPKRGYVRALLWELGADEWRHCLLSTLTEEPTSRTECTRAAAEYASEYFGLQFERLRRGGRIERSVKSAINSCIRRGLVEDYGREMIARVVR